MRNRKLKMNIAPNPKALKQMIAKDISACEALIELLDQEQEALKCRDAVKLSEIINEKGPYLELLEKSANIRNQWASKNQGTTPEDWAEKVQEKEGTEIRSSWDKFKELMQDCKIKNEINGKMISRNQKVFGRLLEILRGQSTSNNLYNATGNADGGNRSQMVGEA